MGWLRRERRHRLSPSRLYLVRWYSLGQRPPSFSELFVAAARRGWQQGHLDYLDRRAARGADWPT